jgi:molecular chaperone DnaK/molecular chaperone HscA
MILDSFDNAEQDIEERQLIETRNEADTILSAVEKGKSHEAWQQLSFDEIGKIEQKVEELKASLVGGDRKIIRNAIDGLDKSTTRFAELMMDSAVGGAMKGKTMASAGESMGAGPTAPHPFAKAEMMPPEDTNSKTDQDSGEKA